MPSISYEEWNSTFGRSHVKVSDTIQESNHTSSSTIGGGDFRL